MNFRVRIELKARWCCVNSAERKEDAADAAGPRRILGWNDVHGRTLMRWCVCRVFVRAHSRRVRCHKRRAGTVCKRLLRATRCAAPNEAAGVNSDRRLASRTFRWHIRRSGHPGIPRRLRMASSACRCDARRVRQRKGLLRTHARSRQTHARRDHMAPSVSTASVAAAPRTPPLMLAGPSADNAAAIVIGWRRTSALSPEVLCTRSSDAAASRQLALPAAPSKVRTDRCIQGVRVKTGAFKRSRFQAIAPPAAPLHLLLQARS